MKFFGSGFVTMLSAAAVVFGTPVPAADTADLSIGDIINALGIKLVEGIEVAVTVNSVWLL